ncbi:hypothetical protein LTR56_025338 [Elasticomyces elasticus]|nr:hypothetical protein LTR22_027782 [Elasticomyces elasticus]KAK3617372.1 hypothetical protein LTR56_025338 [Elasticomyces elasticus]KAK5732628.1 hypothetical protein LTS12_027090 [Elasticomyces elasticus]
MYASPDPQDSKSKVFVRMEGLDHDAAVDLLLEVSELQDRGGQTSQEATDFVTLLDLAERAVAGSEARFAQKELLDTENELARYKKVSATFEVSAQYLTQLAAADASVGDALALLDVLAFVHY